MEKINKVGQDLSVLSLRKSTEINSPSPGAEFQSRLAIAQSRNTPIQQTSVVNIPVRNQTNNQTNVMRGEDDNVNERALSLHAYRLQLLASNIANADTPGYKAVDIDVREALLNGQSVADKTVPLKYHVPSQGSVDGNTVEMDVERAKFAESALRYQYSVDRVRGHYKDMEDLLKNTPY